MIDDVRRKIRSEKELIQQTKDEIRRYLQFQNAVENEDVSGFVVKRWFLIREKAIYNTLNKLKYGKQLTIGLYWIPASFKTLVDQCLQELRLDRNVDGP